MAETDSDMRELDGLLQAARDGARHLPPGLEARILRDAATVQAGFAPRPRRRAGAGMFWAQLRETLGGWPALGGLAAASAAGVWLGFAAPALLSNPAALFSADDGVAVSLFAGDDLALAMLEDG